MSSEYGEERTKEKGKSLPAVFLVGKKENGRRKKKLGLKNILI